MIIASTGRPIPVDEELSNNDLDGANRDCVGAHVVWQGRARAAEKFGVSRHTLWRCLKRGRLGKSLSRTVITTMVDAFTDTRPLTAAAPG